MSFRLSNSEIKKLHVYREDFPLYSKECLLIRTKEGDNVPFELNRMQKVVWYEYVLPKLIKQKPIRLYALKARQLGFSTFTEALGYWFTSLNPFRHSLVISYDEDSASEIFSMCTRFHLFSKDWVRPMRKRSNKKELLFANPKTDEKSLKMNGPGLQSRIRIATAKNPNMGVSSTLQFVHLSEFSRFEQVNSDIRKSMRALKQTVPDKPFTFIIVETTAKGLNYAKEIWDTDEGYEKLFISWLASDEYNLPDDPLDINFLSDIEESEYGDEIKYIPFIEDELKRWYPKLRSASLEEIEYEVLCRLAWRRSKIKLGFDGNLESFREEYPTFAQEAFLTSGDGVFDLDRLVAIKSAIEKVNPVFQRFRWNSITKSLVSHPRGEFKIKEFATPGAIYGIGVDVSSGENDFAAISILKLPQMEQIVTAKFMIDPDDLAYPVEYLARRYNNALVGIEVNGSGVATQNKLKKDLKYTRLYRRTVLDSTSRKYVNKFGWYSDGRSKAFAIETFKGLLRENGIIIWDIDVLDEASHFVRLNDSGKTGALPNKHDDLLIATIVSIQVADQLGTGLDTASRERKLITPGSFDWYNKVLTKLDTLDADSFGMISEEEKENYRVKALTIN